MEGRRQLPVSQAVFWTGTGVVSIAVLWRRAMWRVVTLGDELYAPSVGGGQGRPSDKGREVIRRKMTMIMTTAHTLVSIFFVYDAPAYVSFMVSSLELMAEEVQRTATRVFPMRTVCFVAHVPGGSDEVCVRLAVCAFTYLRVECSKGTDHQVSAKEEGSVPSGRVRSSVRMSCSSCDKHDQFRASRCCFR